MSSWINRSRPSNYKAFKTASAALSRVLLGSTPDYAQFVEAVERHGRTIADSSPNALQSSVERARQNSVAKAFDVEHLALAFALTREASTRTLGLRHRNTQIIGGWAIANGMLAEMQTGEGKSLTATLPASAVALAGLPVHVITANEYLAKRDATQMAPLYRALGLSVGIASENDPPQRRRDAYACAITYCTAKQAAFDFLHERIVHGPGKPCHTRLNRLRGRQTGVDASSFSSPGFAVIDEADSILIDEASTPLVLTRGVLTPGIQSATEQTIYLRALELAKSLVEGRDYYRLGHGNEIALTRNGQLRAAALDEDAEFADLTSPRYDHLLTQALTASRSLKRDRDYIVDRGKVVLIDAHTGRPTPDRSWSLGLQQLVELNEGCELTAARETLARTTYQRFFDRYRKVGGMSGTLSEVGAELKRIYKLRVFSVPPFQPNLRTAVQTRVFTSQLHKWRAIADRAMELRIQGRPTLVGARSIEESEALSQYFLAIGLEHQTLNARQDAKEASIIASAGKREQVTIATNMAGRGTDITLGDGVAELGGLHVIVAECNDCARIDRQLIGRSARQGDPGSFEAILSLDDELIDRFTPRTILALARRASSANSQLCGALAHAVIRAAQRRLERSQREQRRILIQAEKQSAELLSFAGPAE